MKVLNQAQTNEVSGGWYFSLQWWLDAIANDPDHEDPRKIIDYAPTNPNA